MDWVVLEYADGLERWIRLLQVEKIPLKHQDFGIKIHTGLYSREGIEEVVRLRDEQAAEFWVEFCSGVTEAEPRVIRVQVQRHRSITLED